MLDKVLLNVVFVVFPLLVYLIYIVYDNVFKEKGEKLFLNLAIVTSIYFILKYSIYFDYRIDIIKLLLFLVLFSKKFIFGVVLSLFNSFVLNYIYGYELYILLIEFFVIISIFIIFKNNNIKFIFLIIIEVVFSLILNSNIYIIIANVVYVISSYILYKILVSMEKIINIYDTVKVIEYEKDFRNSLFEVTHEIKNPIAVCKGYIDMLDVNNSKQVNKYIPIIKEEIDRTLTLMNDYLNLTKLSINKNVIDISLLLDDVCNSIEEILKHRNVHFMFDILDEEVYINGDYDRLKQVFINLIKNAVEAIDINKIGVIKLRMVLKNQVIVYISDNGVGMSKEAIEKVGSAFYTTKEKGTGLGVKLSMEIIEAHDGSIKYKSKINEGTTVVVKLPFD